ncbi:MAG: STAS domain-containing protein [Planctomycetia bacterium]|nr:STAS domain-containing protein [Planctomycetia bacterium]
MAVDLSFKFEWRKDVLIVVLRDQSYWAEEDLSAELFELVESQRPSKLLLDFADGLGGSCSTYSFMYGDAIFTEVLFRVRRKVNAAGGALKLCGMAEFVRESYRMSNLDGTVFDIHDSVEGALAAFDAERPNAESSS